MQVDRESRVGKTDFLARRGGRGDASPTSEVLVGAADWSYSNWANIMEGLGVLGIDSLDAFLDDVEDDDGLQMTSRVSCVFVEP